MEFKICEKCSNNICAKKVPIFSSLSDEDIKKVVRMTGHREYKKGDYLCHEGDITSALFIVNEGRVKLSKFNKDGKEQILRIISNGSFFGEYYLFSDYEPYNFSAIAITNVKICTLTKLDMDKIINEFPSINTKIMYELSKRLMQTENLAQNLSSNDYESKVAYILIELSEKYGIDTPSGVSITIPINREEMANYAGVTRETMSRKLNDFIKRGLIETKGNKIIILKDKEIILDMI